LFLDSWAAGREDLTQCADDISNGINVSHPRLAEKGSPNTPGYLLGFYKGGFGATWGSQPAPK
jgi:hypothetical protein